ncbi:MAG: alpha/beta fold hydrolase [Candidatus Limnocylindria bacterium]
MRRSAITRQRVYGLQAIRTISDVIRNHDLVHFTAGVDTSGADAVAAAAYVVRIAAAERGLELPFVPERHTTLRAGVRLVWWDWPGGDPATLFLHGIGNYARYWAFVVDAIGGGSRLIAADARGHGESAAPDDLAAFAPAEFVGDALAVMDAAGVQSAVVVGHSMGGGHAVRLAISHPERVRALVLVDWSASPLAEGAGRARRLSLERPNLFADEAAALAYLRESSPGYTDTVYANRIRHAFARGRAGLRWRSSLTALQAILAGRHGAALGVEDLARIACPTVVVRGSRSTVLSAEMARAITEAIPDSRLVELEAGHNVPLERPRELAAAIVGLSAELPSK